MTPLSSVEAEQLLQELGGVPIDRMAWRVVQKGEHYERPERLRMMCFDKAPPSRDRAVGPRKVMTQDLSGMRSGHLRVVAYWGRTDKKYTHNGVRGGGTQYWICMCLCGLFTVMRKQALQRVRRPDEDPLMCAACDSERQRKRSQFRREQGHWPNQPRPSHTGDKSDE
jgi:hypothetical protein